MLEKMIAEAYQSFGSGNIPQAESLCRQILDQAPTNAQAVYLQAGLDQVAGRLQAALTGFCRAVELAPDEPVFINAWGEALHDTGRQDDAFACFQLTIKLRPTYERAYNNLGRIHNQRGEFVAAQQSFIEAIRLNPQYATARNNLGGILLAVGQAPEAVEQLKTAISIRPDYPEAHFNLASALRILGNTADAVVHVQSAIRLRPNYGRGHFLLGQLLVDHGQVASAATFFKNSTQLQPNESQSYHELGNVQLLLEQYDDARASLTKSLELNPLDRRTFTQLCRLKSMILDWTDYAADLATLWKDAEAEIKAGRPAPIVPLHTFGLPWSRDKLLAVARSHSQSREARVKSHFQFPRISEPSLTNDTSRLKIGYLSRDFYDHPVAHQIQGVFGNHDRTKFEIHAYSFSPSDQSTYRHRIENGVDFFHDVTTLRDDELAQRIQSDGIQILVDLMGYTGFARTDCLVMKPAPIQVSWLGYPGTMGANFIDYLIGDAIVTPAEHAEDYSEKLVRMPHSYMPTDGDQPISELRPVRADFGLPDDVIVFCCFHNTYKITPEIFAVWMKILAKVPGSVAWFNARHPLAQSNLQSEAARHGIDSNRIIFASHIPDKPTHLSRLSLADLFLDAPYYNAHVTACDSLWSGLPVLTCPGQSFASRVGASLVTAAGFPELIASDIHDYERRAIELGNNPSTIAGIRTRLEVERTTSPLFDTPRFVRNLEKAFSTMWMNYLLSQAAISINVIEPASNTKSSNPIPE